MAVKKVISPALMNVIRGYFARSPDGEVRTALRTTEESEGLWLCG